MHRPFSIAAVAATGAACLLWSLAGCVDEAAGAHGSTAASAAELPADDLLERARRSGVAEDFDELVANRRARARAEPDNASNWHRLAATLLARAQARTHLRGLEVGRPMFSELPSALREDVRLGLQAVDRARALGDDTGELHRVEASLVSQQITGLTSAIKWSARIHEALEAASARCPEDPQLDVALGLRKLLSPRWLGHDPETALQHFVRAADRSTDERPAVFAGMACYLLEQKERALAWLERAAARNPANRFALVVLQRLRRDEAAPFARDVTVEELAAIQQR